MNYLLKRQPSPSGIVECLLSNTKHSGNRYCFCGNRPRRHPIFRHNVPECRSSTYVSALRVDLKGVKRRISKKGESASKREDTLSAKKATDMIKLMPLKTPKNFAQEKKKVLESRVTTEQLGYNSRYNVDCTKSFDPNMLSCSLDLAKFDFNSIRDNDNSQQSSSYSSKDIKSNKIMQNLESSLGDRNFKDGLGTFTVMPINSIYDLEIDKSEVPLGTLDYTRSSVISEENEDEFATPAEDFDKYTVTINHNFRILQYIHSSVDICVTNDMVKEAFDFLHSYRKKTSWKNFRSKIYSKALQEMYDTLLFALSCKGYWCVMKTVTDWMEMDRVKLSCKSFAALLHCLAKHKKSGNEKFVLQEATKLLNLTFVNKVSLNDIFCKTSLSKEASEEILAIIREVVPSFEIQPDIMKLSSDCSLLKDLHGSLCNLQPQLDRLGGQEMEQLIKEQLMMEKNIYLKVKAVSRGQHGEAPLKNKEMVENLKKEWRIALTKGVNSLQRIHEEEFLNTGDKFKLHLYLKSLPVDRLVDILLETTETMVELSTNYSPPCDCFHKILGQKIFQCYELRKKDISGLIERTEKLFKKYIKWYENPSGPAMNSRQQWQMLIQDSERSQMDEHIVRWPNEVVVKLGEIFLDVILKEIKFTVSTDSGTATIPVLYTMLRYRGNLFRNEIRCHPAVSELFDSVGFDVLNFRSDEIPMFCPPKPWKSPQHGGYLFLQTDLIRKPEGILGKRVKLSDLPVQQLYATFDSLNALQSIPWRINEDVLDVALEVFRSGGSEELNVPLFPRKPPPQEQFTDELSYLERREMHIRRQAIIKNLKNNYSLWCEALYRLSLANHFRKKVFWMPQNCDFRGRVYPVPSLLNHLGSDLYRSLLVFSKGQPLGPEGLDWLKIHLINLTGTHKKKSIKDRLDYANEMLPEILDSAENPLTGNKWWAKSDEPWQTLASCMELKKAISNPNPETYICRLPIHQDGSCNGLQHYAALGKDLIGAQSVNLIPGDKPQDVYSVVARYVQKETAIDASKGVKIAKILNGFIERKVVKQTVMTTVYGVTAYGAKLQIIKRLEDIPNFPQEHLNEAAIYLTEKTFLSLKKMFQSAKQIQEWFINCAGEICKKKDYVQWITPLGLPVVQSYAKVNIHPISKSKVVLPDTLKQKNAFPPNFIHSLDSCHMMLTSLYCEQAGITFAAVHDCFWTHPNTVDIMNKICREQFVLLHSQPILKDLSQFFKKTYIKMGACDAAEEVFDAVPEQGDFDIREIMNSVYFFS